MASEHETKPVSFWSSLQHYCWNKFLGHQSLSLQNTFLTELKITTNYNDGKNILISPVIYFTYNIIAKIIEFLNIILKLKLKILKLNY